MAIGVSIIVAVFGLLIGSFLNVVAGRLPDRESLNGRSHCPRCGYTIGWYDNLPVISWLVLRAKCRNCGLPISWRYPVTELATALLWGGVALASGDWWTVTIGLILMTALVPIFWIDIDHRIIPNRISYPASVIALAINIAHHPDRWWVYVVSAVGAALFFFVPILIYPAGMGLGDVKMAFMLGAFLGAEVTIALAGALVSSLVITVIVLVRKGVRAGRKTKVPFGPFLCIGALIGWWAGHPLLHAYLRTLSH